MIHTKVINDTMNPTVQTKAGLPKKGHQNIRSRLGCQTQRGKQMIRRIQKYIHRNDSDEISLMGCNHPIPYFGRIYTTPEKNIIHWDMSDSSNIRVLVYAAGKP